MKNDNFFIKVVFGFCVVVAVLGLLTQPPFKGFGQAKSVIKSQTLAVDSFEVRLRDLSSRDSVISVSFEHNVAMTKAKISVINGQQGAILASEAVGALPVMVSDSALVDTVAIETPKRKGFFRRVIEKIGG